MARGIDHVVHAVHDLDAAAALYRALGFTVGARNRHPPSWGTQNHVIQFDGCFLELLAIADPAHISEPCAGFFSFGAFNRDFIARQAGLSMLALEGNDAVADAAAFRDGGLGTFGPFDFAREAQRPDGSTVKVAFSLAFASDPKAPDIGFFSCQHRFPENFWNPAFQSHANSAAAVAGVAVVAAKTSDHYRFITALTGVNEVRVTPGGYSLATQRGDIQLVDPVTFERQFGEAPPDVGRSARLAALRFAVRDLRAAAAAMDGAALEPRPYQGKLVLGPKTAMGATLVFEQLRTN